ncbi:MAG: hypothetical protein ACM3ZV_07560 [Bacillota bacterium]
MTVHVTHHAIARYIERVAPVPPDEAYATIAAAERTIETAGRFGSHIVRLPNGARLIIAGVVNFRVVTVLAPGMIHGGLHARLQEPTCCGACGLRTGHPTVRACVRVDCPLPASSRSANDGGLH